MGNRVLIVEDDASIRFGVRRRLERSGFVVAEAVTIEAARARFREFSPDAVLTDFRLPDGDGLELVGSFRKEKPALPIVVLTGYGTIDLAVRAVKTGADNLITKPVDLDRLVEDLHDAFRTPPPKAPPGSEETGPLHGLLELREDVERIKNADCSVLIQGETGTGKTMLARWLHQSGRRKARPFVDLNCAGLARDLVESELFGHERGAFTSAATTKVGMFEQADGGTLFLDEIGDIDLAVQPKLLKAIEEKRFRRMGSARERTVDARVIAATHRDLLHAARSGGFRADLFYRISTVTITIPSLRERRASIPTLAREIVTSLASKLGRAAPALDDAAEAALRDHAWPGNVRELRNVLERTLHFTPGDVIGARDLRFERLPAPPAEPEPTTLRDAKRSHIERALASHSRVAAAAKSLGISRSSMYAKMKAYGLAPATARAKLDAPDDADADEP